MDYNNFFKGNNPLNIKYDNRNNWEGLVEKKPYYTKGKAKFCNFISLYSGVRAGARILKVYREKEVKTIQGIINRWAPHEDDNPVVEYIKYVSRKTGIDPYASVPYDTESYAMIIRAMVKFETGKSLPISNETLSNCVKDAGIFPEKSPAALEAREIKANNAFATKSIGVSVGLASMGGGILSVDALTRAPSVLDAAHRVVTHDFFSWAYGKFFHYIDNAAGIALILMGSLIFLSRFGQMYQSSNVKQILSKNKTSKKRGKK